MKWLLLSISGALIAASACSTLHAQTVAQRQPMEKGASHVYKTPEKYKPRISGYDPKTGDPITYDHKPRVELINAKAHKYALKWIGLDGHEKTATFNRADAVDVTVSATVSQMPSGEYLYTYEVKNLPSSGVYLKRFVVQNFASDAKPEDGGDFWAGKMSHQNRGFSEGNWINFADVSDHIKIDPGQSVMIRLTSSAPPGLVGCRASAETVLEGADEEMPSDLEYLLGGYGEYLRGYTIGPIERLKKLPASERAQYVLDNLPQFHKLGWMTEGALRFYERHLKSGNMGEAFKRAEQDLKAGQITTEVLSIIQALK